MKENENTNEIIQDNKDENKIINIDNEIIEDKKIDLKEVGLLLDQIKKDIKEKNYQKAEDNFKLMFEEKNIESLQDINKETNMIELLNNYALILYHQMKYESATKNLFKIIVNYDNKNKEAYLLLLKILFDINEYEKANLLLEKVNKIMNNNDMEEFNDIGEEIQKKIKIKNNNIKRQYYFNAQKDIFLLKKQLHFFNWIFYSIGALIIGHILSKIFLK